MNIESDECDTYQAHVLAVLTIEWNYDGKGNRYVRKAHDEWWQRPCDISVCKGTDVVGGWFDDFHRYFDREDFEWCDEQGDSVHRIEDTVVVEAVLEVNAYSKTEARNAVHEWARMEEPGSIVMEVHRRRRIDEVVGQIVEVEYLWVQWVT